jgi:hypothetical protein
MKLTALSLAIYLFIGSLFPQMDYSQLGRMDDLLEHFEIHNQELVDNGLDTISFIEFFQLHFISKKQHDHPDEEDHHGKLPFQTINTSLVLAQSSSPVLMQLHVPTQLQATILFTNTFYTSDYITAIFQPPAILS